VAPCKALGVVRGQVRASPRDRSAHIYELEHPWGPMNRSLTTTNILSCTLPPTYNAVPNLHVHQYDAQNWRKHQP
jgi:hypothetical protein